MRPDRRQRSQGRLCRLAGTVFLLAGGFLWGCASPGPPRPPSLLIPRVVTDLTAKRTGDAVALHFTVPGLSTDGQPLRVRSLTGTLCRQDAKAAPCRPVNAAGTAQPLPVPGPGRDPLMVWTDPLPASLRSGRPRPIAYRVELMTPSGKSAGYSDPVYAAAGAAPPPVGDLRAEGTRFGVALHWVPVSGAGEVFLRRVEPEGAPVRPAAPKGKAPEQASGTASGGKGKAHARGAHSGGAVAEKHGDTDPNVVWLQAAPGDEAASATIDNSIEPGVPYRYTAVRREHVQAGGRTLELESSPSAEVAITWRDVYPPAAPTGLMVLGYEIPAGDSHKTPGYAVDLVWEPVEDGQLAGYLVYRQALGGAEEATPGEGVQLTPQPVATPGFHDATALPGQRYRYSVVAVGSHGQRSARVSAEVEPHGVP